MVVIRNRIFDYDKLTGHTCQHIIYFTKLEFGNLQLTVKKKKGITSTHRAVARLTSGGRQKSKVAYELECLYHLLAKFVRKFLLREEKSILALGRRRIMEEKQIS